MDNYRDNPNINIHQFDDDTYADDSYHRVETAVPQSQHQQQRGSNNRVHPLQSGGRKDNSPPGSGLNIADFDSFASDSEKLSAILKCADVEGHKHTLSVDYYRYRKYTLLVPIILMSLFIAIGGFVAASDIMQDHMKVHDSSTQDFLTILVATFGFLVLLLTLLGNGLDYNSKLAFHTAASEDLSGLCDKVRLYRMERAMDERAREEEDELKDLLNGDGGGSEGGDDSSTSSSSSSEEEDPVSVRENALIPHTNTGAIQVAAKKQIKHTKRIQKRNEKITKQMVKQKVRQAREEQELSRDVITFFGYHSELHQITAGCRADVPPTISKFFRVMENRVELMSLSRLGVEEESRLRKNQIVRLCANEVYNEISNHWSWPLSTPNVDRTIETALKRVGQLLNMNYRPPLRCKLIPCCPVALCCKKRTTNNVFAIINEGIDQRELDMMQAERAEHIRMENEKRAKLMAGPEEVLEMRDTIYIGDDINQKKGKQPRGGMGRNPNVSIVGGPGNLHHLPQVGGSRRSRDPEPSVATEPSFSFRSGVPGSGPGGYANHYYSQNSGAKTNLLPQYEEDGMMTEEEETNDGTYNSRSYASYYDEEAGTYYTNEEEEEEAAKKKKKKKKKKSKKKKKKKSKSKKKEEVVEEEDSYDGSDYSEEEHDEGDGFDEYSEYSEEE